ncbi:MAG: MFS transporter [Aestuariivita sp.]|nr:MFS transporter [Aestuariivita sp.]MCY4347616.1 MFS transporter [Aestuariivita sp.]
MFQVLKAAWALLLGMGLLMIGNGMQGTLLGIRGDIENFSTIQLSIIVSSYFVGFLGGSRLAPLMIRRVGHVRVFAALASLISAIMIFYPTVVDPLAWTMARVVIGFCFSGVYVTAESWLNNAASNATRGQALSLYMIVQTSGIVIAQGLILIADPSGFVLFVIPCILVSIAITPILLSISPSPGFEATKPMSLKVLFTQAPLSCVGMLLLGGVFAAQFGMAPVYGAEAGLTVTEISSFVSAFFIGAIMTQFPIGWLSDRMERRKLIVIISCIGTVGAIIGAVFGGIIPLLLLAAFLIGSTSNPLYSLLTAHANDYLELEDMASASGGLIFLNGLGAIAGPLIIGSSMDIFGPKGYFFFLGILVTAISLYGIYRSTKRPAVAAEDSGAYVTMAPIVSPVAVQIAQEIAIDDAKENLAP